MKKERNLLIIILILMSCYGIFNIFVPQVRENWFSFGLLFLSVFMLIKTCIFRSDSSLFLTVLLLLSSIIFSKEIINISNFSQISSYFSMANCVALLIDYVFFYKKIILWTFLLNFFLSFPIFLFITHCINLLLMILFLCGAVVLAVTLTLVKKYGKI